MGCSPSQLPPTGSGQKPGLKPQENGAVANGTKSSKDNDKKISSADLNANHADTWSSKPVQKSIAFVVDLDGRPVDNKLLGAPPPRLKRLAPLNVPKLTAEELAEKQKLADEKREQQLKRKQSASLQMSRRRQKILEAQKLEANIQKMEKVDQIHESLASAEKSREAKMKDIQERQKIREERAKRAREKVKKLQDLDQELALEVEKDTDYNAEEVDSWLGDDENTKNDTSSDSDERIYSGRASPRKRFNPDDKTPTHGINKHTGDSFDKAYTRKPPSASSDKLTGKKNNNTDEFFDT